ncbi:MAG: hypothetical protein COV36_03250 [Alphaproteobacteria bacterium CG11_big_fil_rev_8_21_14_0_20_44_7]|nr:MAG: hypothetical protein COV36_03250 [Alphaproteobacteria bacterium CG11_big_fil_rev_8_21_14_0_20_44_7]
MHLINTILVAMAVVLLCGCNNPITEPKPVLLDTELDYGPPEFRQGYEDGCKSALGAYGNSYQKTAYGLRKDPRYETDRMYNQVWKDGWSYCYMWLFVQGWQEKKSMHGTLF